MTLSRCIFQEFVVTQLSGRSSTLLCFPLSLRDVGRVLDPGMRCDLCLLAL